MTNSNQNRLAVSARADCTSRPHTLRRLFSYALRVWRLLSLVTICVIGTSLLDLAVPWVIGFLLVDRVIRQQDPGRLPFVVLLLMGIFLGQRVLEFGKDYLQELANQRVLNELRCDLYAHTIALPVSFFDRGRTGDLLARVSGDIDTVQGFVEMLMQDIGAELVTLVGTLSFLFAVSARLTLYLLPTVVALASSVFLFKKTVKRFSRRVRNLIGEMASLTEESISGVRTVKVFCAERFEVQRFAAKSLELLRGRIKQAQLSSIYSSTVEVCIFAGTVIVVVVATPKVLAGSLTVGALIAYLGYLNKLYSPVKKLSKINLSIQKILAAGDRVFEVMDLPPELMLPHNSPSRFELPPRIDVSAGPPGAIRFDNVSFGYERDKLVLRNFSLQIDAGEIVALVGPSGSGKSTIVHLLLRFYEPVSGRILIDKVPLAHIPLEKLRRQIGVVSQETFLFSGTARDNIAYAQTEVRREQVVEAAHAAHAHDFIMKSSAGYGVQVGERGVQLSGGERQRIAIARALLRNPSIMIFDEATSQVDSESERLIQESLEKVADGRTVIVVAHRLSTIRHADKIVVIENGEIAEIGKHEELLHGDGIYRKLHKLQMPLPHYN
jgi:subfamily B ATP-binding cassette protein MsbA